MKCNSHATLMLSIASLLVATHGKSPQTCSCLLESGLSELASAKSCCSSWTFWAAAASAVRRDWTCQGNNKHVCSKTNKSPKFSSFMLIESHRCIDLSLSPYLHRSQLTAHLFLESLGLVRSRLMQLTKADEGAWFAMFNRHNIWIHLDHTQVEHENAKNAKTIWSLCNYPKYASKKGSKGPHVCSEFLVILVIECFNLGLSTLLDYPNSLSESHWEQRKIQLKVFIKLGENCRLYWLYSHGQDITHHHSHLFLETVQLL